MAHATFRERLPRANTPMQPRNGEKKMELVECQTCGSHSFTSGKCDYCGNQYEVNEDKIFYGNVQSEETKEKQLEMILDSFKDEKGNEKAFKIMLIILVSIIWFAVTVFIPPLFIITIILLVVYIVYRLTIKNK